MNPVGLRALSASRAPTRKRRTHSWLPGSFWPRLSQGLPTSRPHCLQQPPLSWAGQARGSTVTQAETRTTPHGVSDQTSEGLSQPQLPHPKNGSNRILHSSPWSVNKCILNTYYVCARHCSRSLGHKTGEAPALMEVSLRKVTLTISKVIKLILDEGTYMGW